MALVMKYPAGHGLQAVWPSAVVNVPVGQGVHDEEELAGAMALYGHGEQDVCAALEA